MFVGDSDPCNWGTGGIAPNGGYTFDGKYWTEYQVWNAPYQRFGIGAAGPFTFEPGDHQQLDLAFHVTLDSAGNDETVDRLFSNLEDLINRIHGGEILVPFEELKITEKSPLSDCIQLYPNPATNSITIKSKIEFQNDFTYYIYDQLGRVILTGNGNSRNGVVNISELDNGMYLIRINADGQQLVNKFVKANY